MGLAGSGGRVRQVGCCIEQNALDFRFKKGLFWQKLTRMRPGSSRLKRSFGPTILNYQKYSEISPKSTSFRPAFSARRPPTRKKYTWATLLRVYRAAFGCSRQIWSSGRPLDLTRTDPWAFWGDPQRGEKCSTPCSGPLLPRVWGSGGADLRPSGPPLDPPPAHHPIYRGRAKGR